MSFTIACALALFLAASVIRVSDLRTMALMAAYRLRDRFAGPNWRDARLCVHWSDDGERWRYGRAYRRKPNIYIGGIENPYMTRWHVIPRNRFLNVYLHYFQRSDDDRALHDHPWWNLSFIFDGSYLEHTPDGVTRRETGTWAWRKATQSHRVELDKGPCWTLFVTGPRVREWGFHCPKGWRHWREFTTPGNTGTVGKGCGEE